MSKNKLICRLCGDPLTQTFCDLGMTPLSNSYLKEEDLNNPETFYPLHARVCSSCTLVQLPEFEDPRAIFSDYAYFSSYSTSWLEHCRRYVQDVISELNLTSKNRVVEIASNDGYLLQNFLQYNIPVLGIEPAGNVAKVAISNGVPTTQAFFGLNTSKRVLETFGSAHLIIANNVLAHVPDINDFVVGIANLLDTEGVATLEFPHLLAMLTGNQFDTIYHEHFSYISLTAAVKLFSQHGLKIFDVQHQATHGGSLRIWACHSRNETNSVSKNVKKVLSDEESAGLTSADRYLEFASTVRDIKFSLVSMLLKLRMSGSRVVAYGAAAKGNTLLNYCGISRDLVEYVVDMSPHKQGKYLPGTHIPIYAVERLKMDRPTHILLLPWNITDEIRNQLEYVRDWGSKFIVAIPDVKIIE